MAIHDFDATPAGDPYIVMEFVPGSTLEDLLRAGPLDQTTALEILSGVAAALCAAHDAGLIHGDLKPSNIKITARSGQEPAVKVLDFGVSTMMGQVPVRLAGTPRYMAPEQLQNVGVLPATDCFAAGLIFAEMLTGFPVYPTLNDRVAALEHDGPIDTTGMPLPENTLDIIASTTHTSLEHRCQDGRALVDALTRLAFQEEPHSSHELAAVGSTFGGRSGLFPIHNTESFKGTAADQAMLMATVDEVAQYRKGRIVVLGGDAGLGHGVLCRWLRDDCSSWDDVRAGVEAVRGDGDLRWVTQLLAGTLRLGTTPDARRLTAGISRVLGRALLDGEVSTLLAASGWWRGGHTNVDVLANLIIEIAGKTPMILCLTSMREAGKAAIELVLSLAARMETAPSRLLLVLCVEREGLAERPDLVEVFGRLCSRPHVTAHRLKPLAAGGVLDMVRRAAASRLGVSQLNIDGRLAAAVVEASAGNPTAALQSLTFALGTGLALKDATLTMTTTSGNTSLYAPGLSRRLRSSLARRLAGHDDGAAMDLVVRRAALLDESFTTADLEALLDAEAAAGHNCARHAARDVTALVAGLVKADVLVAHPEEQWTFAQPLVRRAIRAALPGLPNYLTTLRLFQSVFLRKPLDLPTPARRSHPHYWDPHKNCWDGLSITRETRARTGTARHT